MTRKSWLGIVGAALALSVFTLGWLGCKPQQPPAPDQAPKGEVIKLSYSIFFPPTHKNNILAQEWAK